MKDNPRNDEKHDGWNDGTAKEDTWCPECVKEMMGNEKMMEMMEKWATKWIWEKNEDKVK
jgi:hypothetical protein